MSNQKFQFWRRICTTILLSALFAVPGFTAEDNPMTVQQLMQTVITPATNTLWGAYDIKTDAQWQELETAAQEVIRAGELLKTGGTSPEDALKAANQDWQEFAQQMINAGRNALTAIGKHDEEALSAAGNDELYPPCESCHGKYMTH